MINSDKIVKLKEKIELRWCSGRVHEHPTEPQNQKKGMSMIKLIIETLKLIIAIIYLIVNILRGEG